MEIKTFPIGPLQTNCFVLASDGQAVVIDPGGDPAPVLDYLERNKLTLTHILDTHLHCDHIYGNKALSRATGVPIYANPEDEFLMQTGVGNGSLVGIMVEDFEFTPIGPGRAEFAGLECDVLATPGHTPGSLSFYFPKAGAVFAGDLIFQRSIGRTDFPGGSMETLLTSVREKIFTLPGDTAIYPGHGPATTVEDESRNNPFFSEYGL